MRSCFVDSNARPTTVVWYRAKWRANWAVLAKTRAAHIGHAHPVRMEQPRVAPRTAKAPDRARTSSATAAVSAWGGGLDVECDSKRPPASGQR